MESCGLIMQTEVCRGELMDVDDGCFDWLEAGMGLTATYVQHMLINKQKTLIYCAKHVPPAEKDLDKRVGRGGVEVGCKHFKAVGWVIRFPPKALAPVMLSSLDYLC